MESDVTTELEEKTRKQTLLEELREDKILNEAITKFERLSAEDRAYMVIKAYCTNFDFPTPDEYPDDPEGYREAIGRVDHLNASFNKWLTDPRNGKAIDRAFDKLDAELGLAVSGQQV